MVISKLERKSDPIIIIGTTLTGQKFRPSDWAQRLTVAVSSVGPKKQIISHPRVHMAMQNGVPAVIIDPVLKQENPMMYKFLINFGKSNNLQIEYPWIGDSEKKVQPELQAVS